MKNKTKTRLTVFSDKTELHGIQCS